MKRAHTAPSERAELARHQERARAIVEGRLAEAGRNWNWLAQSAAEAGICSTAVIHHWRRGRNRGINVGVYLACLEILEDA
jgi:hypothetical protein